MGLIKLHLRSISLDIQLFYHKKLKQPYLDWKLARIERKIRRLRGE